MARSVELVNNRRDRVLAGVVNQQVVVAQVKLGIPVINLAGDRPCPINRRVYELIKRMESERIPPSLEMLKSLPTQEDLIGV